MSFTKHTFFPSFLIVFAHKKDFKTSVHRYSLMHREVLEIGVGTGLNFEFYDFDKVTSVKGIDPAISSLEIAKKESSI